MGNNKIVNIINKFIFYVYVFLSIYETYISEIVGNVTRFYLIVFCGFLLLNIRKKPLSVNQLLIIMWLSLYYVSLLWTPDFQHASLYIGTVTAMSCAVLLCENCFFTKDFMDDVVSMYKWCSVSMAFLGLFFSEPISINDTGRLVLTIAGIQPDPNNLVALYAIGSGLTLFEIKVGGRYKVANLLGLLVCVYCILITGSRSGILILGVQFILWFFYVNRNVSYFVKILGIIILTSVIGYIMLVTVNMETIERMLGLGDLAFTDGTGRESLWEMAIDKFYSSPIVGNGWGAYSAHNTFFTILVDIGIVGLVLIVIYLIRLFFRILRYERTSALVIFISGLIQSFLIDAQNTRFFWNIIIFSMLIINSYAYTLSTSNNTTEN